LESQPGCIGNENNDKYVKYLKYAPKTITTITEGNLKAMNSKENSDKFNTSMIEDDLIEPVDQSIRSIRETCDVFERTPLRKGAKVKIIPYHITLSHDHPCTYVDSNSSGTMLTKYSETLCESSTMVTSGSHFSNVHLRLDILKGYHAILSSSTHNDISLKNGEDVGERREYHECLRDENTYNGLISGNGKSPYYNMFADQ